MAAPNPFKPTAGATPPVLVGRDELLEEFEAALDDGPGAPGRLALITGTRGVGKTVMLTAFGTAAKSQGWVTIDDAATPGLVQRVTLSAAKALKERPHAKVGKTLSSITLNVLGSGAGINFNSPAENAVTLHSVLEELIRDLESTEVGLLLTIDEVHNEQRDELRDVASVAQLLIRDDRNFSIVFAGLPSAVSDLLNDNVLTFLRRADRITLEDVPASEVRTALAETIRNNGYTIDEDALILATDATGGYPFMIQLVGYWVARSPRGAYRSRRCDEGRGQGQNTSRQHRPCCSPARAVRRRPHLSGRHGSGQRPVGHG